VGLKTGIPMFKQIFIHGIFLNSIVVPSGAEHNFMKSYTVYIHGTYWD
jgi:hypothetical protein